MSQAQEPSRASRKKSAPAQPAPSKSADPEKKGRAARRAQSIKPSPVSTVAGSGAAAQAGTADLDRPDLAAELWLRFGKYVWDAFGVSLIALAFLTLIGFIIAWLQPGWSQGLLLSFWLRFIGQAVGWGWPLVSISFGLLGLLCLRRTTRFHLGRVISIELLAFCMLTLLSILGGLSLDNAEAGLDGGVVGWGLAALLDRLLPVPWSTLFLLILMVLFATYGFGLMAWAVRELERWTNAVPPQSAEPQHATVLPATKAPGGAAEEEEEVPPPVAQNPAVRDPHLPPLTLLLDEQSVRPDDKQIQDTAQIIEHTLSEFGVPARVVGFRVGPTVTQFAVEPGFVEKPGPTEGEVIRQKVRVSQISALSRDLALSLSAERLRIEAPVPGRSYVGIEVPNQLSSVVRMRPLLESETFCKLSSPLSVALGRDVSGQPLVADLARMPHLLIAGTTGSGKSVCITALVTCLVMNNQPANLRMALLDPKMVELARFNGLPHLFGNVETELERMLAVLRWALTEMDHRYRLLEDAHTRDLETYNRKAAKRGQPTLPRIVVIVDELADLMMTAPDQTEHSLIRLAQMARATGIHLVVATQRPSTDVVTGLIKANFPARLAFTVASSIDSRVILDNTGAETLLGKGDMLFLNPESGTPLRAQGTLISDEEIEAVIGFWKQSATEAQLAEGAAPWEELIEAEDEEGSDQLVQQAIQIVRATGRASTSLLQRRLRVGYPRAARLMDQLEDLGVVGPSQGGGREREVLVDPEPGDDLDGSSHPPSSEE